MVSAAPATSAAKSATTWFMSGSKLANSTSGRLGLLHEVVPPAVIRILGEDAVRRLDVEGLCEYQKRCEEQQGKSHKGIHCYDITLHPHTSIRTLTGSPSIRPILSKTMAVSSPPGNLPNS